MKEKKAVLVLFVFLHGIVLVIFFMFSSNKLFSHSSIHIWKMVASLTPLSFFHFEVDELLKQFLFISNRTLRTKLHNEAWHLD